MLLAQSLGNPLPVDQRVAFILLDVAIILVVARLVGALFVRIGQPRVVGEIVAGILLGPTIFGADMFKWENPWKVLSCAPDSSLLNDIATIKSGTTTPAAQPTISSCFFPSEARIGLVLLGTVALALFMFLVGLELDMASLKGKYRGILSVGIGVVVIPIASAFLLAPVLYDEKFALSVNGVLPEELGFTLMVGAMLAVTAFPVAARILQEKGLATTPLGAVGIAAAAVVTILMFLALGVATGVAKDAEGSVHVKRIVGTILFLAVMWVVVRPILAKVLTTQRIGASMHSTFFVTAMVVVLLSAYTADRIGVNAIVGGFMAGLVMPRVPVLVKGLQNSLSEITIAVLLPVFLAVSGLNTNFRRLGWDWAIGIGLFIVVAIVSKWGGGWVSGRIGGLDNRDSNALGVLMNCRGLLVLVVALAAKEAGVITDQMQVGAVLMALITTGMTGPLVDKFLPKAQPKAAEVVAGG